MILLSHPRSGSNWFMSGLTEYTYTPLEIFGTEEIKKHYRPDEYVFKNISMKARLAMAKIDKKKFFKIQFCDIDRNSDLSARNYLIENLQKMDNLYLLTRRDVKKTLISLAVGFKNGWNFHGDNNNLVNKFSLTIMDLLLYYELSYGALDRYKDYFNFKEKFIYEDLISGQQVPQTLGWDPSKSQIKERNSMNYIHLIENWDQVETWIEELIPYKEFNV